MSKETDPTRALAIQSIWDFVDEGSMGSLDIARSFSQAGLCLKLEVKHQDLISISMIVRVLFRMNESLPTNYVIQCCMTRTISSNRFQFSSLSSS